MMNLPSGCRKGPKLRNATGRQPAVLQWVQALFGRSHGSAYGPHVHVAALRDSDVRLGSISRVSAGGTHDAISLARELVLDVEHAHTCILIGAEYARGCRKQRIRASVVTQSRNRVADIFGRAMQQILPLHHSTLPFRWRAEARASSSLPSLRSVTVQPATEQLHSTSCVAAEGLKLVHRKERP